LGGLKGKILLTTLLFAGFGITALCHLAVVGRTLRIVGFVGIAVSALAFITGAILIWRSWESWSDVWELTLKTFAVFAIAAASLAHANLLLLLSGRRNQVLRIGLWVTLGLIALLAVLIILPIVTEGDIPGDNGEPSTFGLCGQPLRLAQSLPAQPRSCRRPPPATRRCRPLATPAFQQTAVNVQGRGRCYN